MRLSLALLLATLSPSVAFAGPLTARIEGGDVIVTRDGKDAPLGRTDLANAVLARVPLKADGSEEAIWVSTRSTLLVRWTDKPQVVGSFANGSVGAYRQTSTSTSAWLVDLDGDGWNDLALYTTEHSDVGMQAQTPEVRRWDVASGAFVDAPGLRKRLPRPPWSMRFDKLVAAQLKGKIEPRGAADGRIVPLPSGADPYSMLTPSLPWVGPDALFLALARQPADKKDADYYLVHVRLVPTPSVVTMHALGRWVWPPDHCRSISGSFKLEADTAIVRWPQAGATLAEARLPWKGGVLGPPVVPALPIGFCTDPLPKK